MLLRYYGFREDPFGATPDPRCLYQSPTHCEALASLKYGLLQQPRLYCPDRVTGNGQDDPLVPLPGGDSYIRADRVYFRYRSSVRAARNCQLHPA